MTECSANHICFFANTEILTDHILEMFRAGRNICVVLSWSETGNFLLNTMTKGNLLPYDINYINPEINGYYKEYTIFFNHLRNNYYISVEPSYCEKSDIYLDVNGVHEFADIILLSQNISMKLFKKYTDKKDNNCILFKINS